MELVFTAITIALAGAIYLLYQHFRGTCALCRRPMAEWLSRFAAASPIEQHEMAETLLQQSLALAARMGVQLNAADLAEAAGEPTALVDSWRSRLPDILPAAYIAKSPARTLGALMLIHQVDPQRFRQLVGLPAGD